MNEETKKYIKVCVVVGTVCVIVLMLGEIIGLKRTIRMQNYAAQNNCVWIWQGTAYGDDRDYLCVTE